MKVVESRPASRLVALAFGLGLLLTLAFTSPTAPTRHPTWNFGPAAPHVWVHDPAVTSTIGNATALATTCTDSQNASFYWDGGSLALNCLQNTTMLSAPTLSGFCTSPTITWHDTMVDGRMTRSIFQLDVGGSCVASSTGTITFPTAANGWVCNCFNISVQPRFIQQSGGTTTTATIAQFILNTGLGSPWTNGEDLRCDCGGD